MHSKRNYYIIALIMFTFFVISFLTNIIGPLLPDIIINFNLSLTLAGILPFAFFIAYGVMSIPSGLLIEKYQEKKIMITGFALAFIGSLLLTLSPNYLTIILSLFLIGCGMAMLQVAINPLLRISGGAEHYAFNSVLAQLIFGVASFLSPLVYSYIVLHLNDSNTFLSSLRSFVPENIPWLLLYWLFAVICLFMIIVIFFSKFPKVELTKEEKAGIIQTHIMLLKKRVVILYFIAMICYVGTEQGVANWLSQFLSTYHGYDPQTTGAQDVAYFWGLLTAGGVVGLLLLKIMDSRKVLIIFTVLTLVCLTFALFATAKISLIAFPLIGFFASIMYPVIISLALNSVKEHHGSFSGIILTGIMGGAIIPFIIGWLGNHFGLRFGMFFLYLTMGYILSVGFWARPIITNKTIKIFSKK